MTQTKKTYNSHEREAIKLANYYLSEFIGGYENSLLDNDEDSEEYKNAYEFLHSGRENLVETIYTSVMHDQRGHEKHLRFAGEKFIKDFINRKLEKWGY